MIPIILRTLIKLFMIIKYWNELDGKIGRSLRFDTRNKDGKLGMVSIIIDAKKPIVIGEK